MRPSTVRPTGIERTFGVDEIIVTKTDSKGVIRYANDTFLRVSALEERDALGQPHSIIRHPDMPRAVFRLLWDTLTAGDEIFAYIVNLATDGAHYWVLAHVTPSRDAGGRVVGYHSNRRTPERSAVRAAEDLYASLRAEERRHSSPRDAVEASYALLQREMRERGTTYEEYVWQLTNDAQAVA